MKFRVWLKDGKPVKLCEKVIVNSLDGTIVLHFKDFCVWYPRENVSSWEGVPD